MILAARVNCADEHLQQRPHGVPGLSRRRDLAELVDVWHR